MADWVDRCSCISDGCPGHSRVQEPRRLAQGTLRIGDARNHHVATRRGQRPQIRDDEEQGAAPTETGGGTMIKVAVSGLRSDPSEWEAALATPEEKLPPLSPEQRRVAQQLHIKEGDYQRSFLAGNRTAEKLLKKAEWFAKLLRKDLSARAPDTTIKSVVLDTWKHRFEITIEANGSELPLHIAEGIVDDLFDLGSSGAEQRLSETIERCLHLLGVS